MERRIYHITHLSNLPSIIADGSLWSDRELLSRSSSQTVIGYQRIKDRRLSEHKVTCHQGTMVGDYVPFYFCPRSPMLFVIHRRNSALAYQGGQEQVVHLVSCVSKAIAVAADRRWAFSDGNASTQFTQFSSDLRMLDQFVNWNAVQATDWRDPAVKEKKQAEFLVERWFPWTAFAGIGVCNHAIATRVNQLLADAAHRPKVTIEPSWYY